MTRTIVLILLTISGAAYMPTGGWKFDGQIDAAAPAKTFTLVLTNPSHFARPDELVKLSRKEIEKRTGILAAKDYVQISATHPVVVQQDDLDGDGLWDEAVFLYSFAPRQVVPLRLQIAGRPGAIKMAPRSAMHLYKRDSSGAFGPALQHEIMPYNLPANDFSKSPVPLYHVEGPTWENDKVAFRSYFDVRNAKDIFGKTTVSMVMDQVGLRNDNYHALDTTWGMDILKVGSSLGAGAVGMLVGKEGKDSLYRPGGPDVGITEFEQVASGPLRSVLRIRYQDWKVEGRTYDVTEEISIWGGQYFYENRLSVSEKATLFTGIVNLHSSRLHSLQHAGKQILYTHDRQSENQDYLGMAVMSGADDFLRAGSAPKEGTGIRDTYTFVFKEKETPVTYRFYTGWEKTLSRFSSREYFETMLKNEADKWAHPVKLQWK